MATLSLAEAAGKDGNFGVKITRIVKCPESRCRKKMLRSELLSHMSARHRMFLVDFRELNPPFMTRICYLTPSRLANGEYDSTWKWVARVFHWGDYTFFLHVKVQDRDTFLMWVSLFVEQPKEVTKEAQQLVCSLRLKTPEQKDPVDKSQQRSWTGIVLPTNFDDEAVPQFKVSRQDIRQIKYKRKGGEKFYWNVELSVGKFAKCRQLCTMRYLALLNEERDPNPKPKKVFVTTPIPAEPAALAPTISDPVSGVPSQELTSKDESENSNTKNPSPDCLGNEEKKVVFRVRLMKRKLIELSDITQDSESEDSVEEEEEWADKLVRLMPPDLVPIQAQAECSDSDDSSESGEEKFIVLLKRQIFTTENLLDIFEVE